MDLENGRELGRRLPRRCVLPAFNAGTGLAKSKRRRADAWDAERTILTSFRRTDRTMQVSGVVAEALGLLGPRKHDGIHSGKCVSQAGSSSAAVVAWSLFSFES
jgi:hypothetical protein